MSKVLIAKIVCIIGIACVTGAVVCQAQSFTSLMSFDSGSGGQTIASPLNQGTNGDLMGLTALGGAHTYGTAYEITPFGKEVYSYSYCSLPNCSDGEMPYAQLVLASDGNFYGTASGGGGSTGGGTVFKITPEGQVTTIYAFCSLANCADGDNSAVPLVEGRNGDLYGGTRYGGTPTHCVYTVGGCGTIFRVTKSGILTALYSMCSLSQCADGYDPFLTLGADGNLYGITSGVGGVGSGNGTFFRITPAGKFTLLHHFNGTSDGAVPQGIILGADGNFYGTTQYGGANGGGSIFKITPTGELTSLYSFCIDLSCSDGYQPLATLIQASDGNFYGTTEFGGTQSNPNCYFSCGTIFQITPAGVLTTLHSFCMETNCADGANPWTGLVQHTDGAFYGTTLAGGDKKLCTNCGTVYSLSMGLGPFVRPNPVAGKPGYTINILGTKLTGTTQVTFNGVPAAFTVRSSTLLKVVVPNEATTGTIEVTTPNGTLSSNVAFQVLP